MLLIFYNRAINTVFREDVLEVRMQSKLNCRARYNKNNWRVVSPHSMLFHVRLKKVMGIVLGKGFDYHMLRCRGNTPSRNERVSTRRPFYCYFFFYVCFSLLLNLVSCSNSAFKQDFSEIKKSYPADLLTKNQKTVGKVELSQTHVSDR